MAKKVAIIMGSDSDLPVVKDAAKELKDFGVEFEIHVMSAHRTPEAAAEFAKNAADNGFGVIIAAAGMAAHLGGVLAAYTILPVIGIPMESSRLDGMDALLATVLRQDIRSCWEGFLLLLTPVLPQARFSLHN